MSSMERAISTIPANEIWRPVRDFEGLYEVSNLARVRSVDRSITAVYKGTIYTRNLKGRILKQRKIHRGYCAITLQSASYFIHRMVAEAFVPNPDNLPEVNHKDENKLNNCADNLEWCDRLYNVNYGTGIQRREKSIEQLTMAGQHIAYYSSIIDAARQLGHDQSYITKACRGIRKSAYGYQWRYV